MRAKRSGRSKTYYDTADPTPKLKEIPALIDKVLKTDKVDILSVNENEAIIFASILDLGLKEKKERLGFAELAMEAARVLAKHLPARIDLAYHCFFRYLKGQKGGGGSSVQS